MLSSGGVSDEVKCEDLVKVTIGDDPEKFFQVGSQLSTSLHGMLMRLQEWSQTSFVTI